MLTDKELQSMLPTNLVLEPGETRIGLFAIRLDQIDLSAFKKLRKVFPRHEYILMKGRIKARFNRKIKRDTLAELTQTNAALKAENKKLK